MKTLDNRSRDTRDRPQLVKDGKVTHVLVPIDEYEELVAEALVAGAMSKLTSQAKWIGAREVGLRLAGKRIANARKALKLTQRELAKKLDISQSEVSRIENNPDNTTIRTLRKLAAALEVDVRALI